VPRSGYIAASLIAHARAVFNVLSPK